MLVLSVLKDACFQYYLNVYAGYWQSTGNQFVSLNKLKEIKTNCPQILSRNGILPIRDFWQYYLSS